MSWHTRPTDDAWKRVTLAHIASLDQRIWLRCPQGQRNRGVYNHYEYDAEKRAALELWADALAGLRGKGPAEIDGYHVRLSRMKGMDRIKVG